MAISNVLNLFKRKSTVIYRAPGFLHGSYSVVKRGSITHTDLVIDAMKQKFGDNADFSLLPAAVRNLRIEVQGVY